MAYGSPCRSLFLETFAGTSWSTLRYAYFFHYMSRTLIDYALKKAQLLRTLNPGISEQTQIDLIACGLPPFICEKLDHDAITTYRKLITELTKLETYANKSKSVGAKPNDQQKHTTSQPTSKSNYKPCSICERQGKPGRYHPEAKCMNNVKKTNGTK